MPASQLLIPIDIATRRSHGTYYFIAAGCHISVKNYAQAQKLLDAIPGLIDKKKIGGKDLPTEVFIKKKREFFRPSSSEALLTYIRQLLSIERSRRDVPEPKRISFTASRSAQLKV